ncbi:MAG TPA: hypothetical protein VES20_20190 [Bryobacteraceae bacterium]|nr:hypothetical protein [Bryobacteraceae bacterium]
MNTRLEKFLIVSQHLVSFDPFLLLGTGVAVDYLRTLDQSVPKGISEAFVNTADQFSGCSDAEAVATSLLNDFTLGPVARNIIMLWYLGSWMALPAEWHAAYGTSETERTGVVSAAAYQAGLQWEIIGAHPPGSRQQGFASWANAGSRAAVAGRS